MPKGRLNSGVVLQEIELDYLEIALFIIGAGLLILGYRRTNRDVLVVAALLLFLAGSIGDFFSGFVDGVNGSRTAAVQPTDQERHHFG